MCSLKARARAGTCPSTTQLEFVVDFLFACFTIRASEFAFASTCFPISEVCCCKLRVAQVSADETGVLGRVLWGITTRKALETHCGSFVKNSVVQHFCIEVCARTWDFACPTDVVRLGANTCMTGFSVCREVFSTHLFFACLACVALLTAQSGIPCRIVM